ncbi:hypothetical protein FOZ61_008510 [Perkinsus olseni]|uniref:Methyltransferase domain-containing protein n=1 Tax=Perkinsus olseni TaxID=32597 RepID=A0A7J6L4A6_PEROL|nr:hypothetical protein FOZ61_008510 [Perkinsus olseni]
MVDRQKFLEEVESIKTLCAGERYSGGWKRLLALGKMPEARIEPARIILEQLRERLRHDSVDEWHLRMLNDGGRNRAYRRAIVKAIRDRGEEIDHVIDVGCGTGILSCYLAECAPPKTKITACDCSWAICEVARRACGSRVDVVQVDSADLALETPADMVVAELMDCALLGEGFVDVVKDLRSRGQMKEEAVVIPECGRVFGCVVESEAIRDRGYYFSESVRLEEAYASVHKSEGLRYRKLTDTFTVCTADFRRGEIGGLGRREVEVREGGLCACVLVWWEATLYGDIRIDSVVDCDWDYAVFPCPPREVEKGQKMGVRVSCEDSKLSVTFDGSYVTGAPGVSEFDIMTASRIRREGYAGIRSGGLSNDGVVIDLTGVGHSVIPCLLANGCRGPFVSWMPREGDGLWSILRDQLEHFRIFPEDFAKSVRVVEADSQQEFFEEVLHVGMLQRYHLGEVIRQPVLPWGAIDAESLKLVSMLSERVGISPTRVLHCKGCWTTSAAVRAASEVEEGTVPEAIRDEANRGELLRVGRLMDFPLEDLNTSGVSHGGLFNSGGRRVSIWQDPGSNPRGGYGFGIAVHPFASAEYWSLRDSLQRGWWRRGNQDNVQTWVGSYHADFAVDRACQQQ